MSDKILSIEELKNLQGGFTEAVQSDEPVAIQTPTHNVVNGNPALSGSNSPKSYTLTLYLPVNASTPKDAKLVMGGTAYEQQIVAEQKFITARVARKVRNYASTIAMAFTEFKEEGETELYTVEDILKVYEIFDDSVIDACEKLVFTVLGLPEHLTQHVTDTSLMQVCTDILKNNPSFFQND